MFISQTLQDNLHLKTGKTTLFHEFLKKILDLELLCYLQLATKKYISRSSMLLFDFLQRFYS